MRAADVAEKVSAQRPELLQPFRSSLRARVVPLGRKAKAERDKHAPGDALQRRPHPRAAERIAGNGYALALGP